MADAEQDRHLKLTGEFDCEPTPLRHAAPLHLARDGPGGKRLFPDGAVAIGPAIEDGFYYDFAKAEPFTPEDLAQIEARHARDRDGRPALRAEEMPREEAIRFFRERGEPFKVEILEGIDADRGVALPAGRLHRPLPRARTWRRRGRSRPSSSCPPRAPTGGATRTTPCSSASTGRPGSRRRISTSTCGGSRRRRSATTASSGASWISSTSTTSRPARPSGCPTA